MQKDILIKRTPRQVHAKRQRRQRHKLRQVRDKDNEWAPHLPKDAFLHTYTYRHIYVYV